VIGDLVGLVTKTRFLGFISTLKSFLEQSLVEKVLDQAATWPLD
jgi:hypothetical protein